MKKELLRYLVCPVTRERLRLSKPVYGVRGEIRSGTLVSVTSGKRYPVVEYIPIMLTGEEDKSRYKGWAYQWRNKRFEFNTAPDDIGVRREHIIDEYRLDRIAFDGGLVCEAGCGGGRLTGVLYRRECRAHFCVDISDAVYEARAKHGLLPNTHFIMADIAALPFSDESLDIVLNLAVLQHTANPQQTLYGLARALKPSGIILTGHYMTPSNPFVRLKVFYCELLHKSFRLFRIPPRLVMAFTYLSVLAYRYLLLRPLAWALFHKPPGAWDDKVVWQNNFDFYNPGTYQHWKTEEQTRTMLLKAGLVPLLETRVFPNGYVCEKRL